MHHHRQKLNLKQKCEITRFHNALKNQAQLYPEAKACRFLTKMAEYHIELAAKCLATMCYESNSKMKSLENDIIKKARQQSKSFRQQTQTSRSFYALITLKKSELISEAFAHLRYIDDTHRNFIPLLLQNRSASDCVFLLNALFQNTKHLELLHIGIQSLDPQLQYYAEERKQLQEIIDVFVKQENDVKTKASDFEISPILFDMYLNCKVMRPYMRQQFLTFQNRQKLHTFYIRLSEQHDKELAQKFEQGLPPNSITKNDILYNIDIKNARSLEAAMLIVQKMKQNKVTPDEITYTTLLKKARNFNKAMQLFEEMHDLNLKLDEISYSTLLNKANTFEQAKNIVQEMHELNLKPNEISYSTLLNKANTFEQAKNIVQEMHDLNFQLDEISYSTLLNKANTFEQAKNIVQEMHDRGIRPKIVTYNTLLKKASYFLRGETQFEESIKILEMLVYTPRIRPQYKNGKTYTLRAVVGIFKYHRAAFETWFGQQHGLSPMWQDFFMYVALDLERNTKYRSRSSSNKKRRHKRPRRRHKDE